MAEGGEFGMDNPDRDRDIDNDDNNDDSDDGADTTRPFQPGTASTPYHGGEQYEMQTMHHEQSGLPETSYDESIPLLEGFTHDDDKPALLERAKNYIKNRYPKVDFGKLPPISSGKKSGNYDKIVTIGPRGGESAIFKSDDRSLLKTFTEKFKKALGPDAESLIAQDNAEIRNDRQRLRESEKQLRDAQKLTSEREKIAQEVEKLRNKNERVTAQIDAHTQEHGTTIESELELRRLQQLKKNLQNDFENAKKELAALDKQAKTKDKEQKSVDQLRAKIAAKKRERNLKEERLNDTRTLDEMKEQEAELKRQNEKDKAIIDNPDASPSDKQAAEGRYAEREEELARLLTQIDERERGLPLRERVKEIFKKYGVTVTAIVIAAGVTIGAVVGAITNALKATGKALGKGLKDIGSKLASILPGFIGSIVGFLFKAAGQAIGFLAKHTWLIILAVVAFLVEKYIKKR